MKISNIACLTLALGAAVACSGPKGWTVEGHLSGVEKGDKVAVEALNNGIWYALDSVSVGSDGQFRYSSPTPAVRPEVYRISLPSGVVCFPVDSADVVNIEPAANGGYTLSGTYMAQMVGRVDSLIASAVAQRKASASDPELRRALVSVITNDTTGLVAYYTIGKVVGNELIFDPADNFGNRVYGAAAQVYATHHPLDPRGQMLREAYMQGRVALGKVDVSNLPEQTIEANLTGLIDIVRYDDKGKRHSLAELADQGKVIILNFTSYGRESSPAYNIMLNDLYTLYKDKGLEIYQIAFDGDEVQWKTSARNLPWITVWNSPTDGISALTSYNVGAVPMSFIINRKGEVAKRVANPDDLPAEVAKYF